MYTGIGSDGRYETYRDGTFADGVIQYRGKSADGWARISIGPFDNPERVPFNVHTSKDGETWEEAQGFEYVRIE